MRTKLRSFRRAVFRRKKATAPYRDVDSLSAQLQSTQEKLASLWKKEELLRKMELELARRKTIPEGLHLPSEQKKPPNLSTEGRGTVGKTKPLD